MVISVTLTTYEKHLQNTARVHFIFDRNISKKEEYNAHDFRELRIQNENMPFLHQEEPFLALRRACSRT